MDTKRDRLRETNGHREKQVDGHRQTKEQSMLNGE